MKRLWWCRSWSVGAPASLAEENPLVPEFTYAQGMSFWQQFTPVLGLITLRPMLTSFRGSGASSGVAGRTTGFVPPGFEIATLVYFRPVLIGMLVLVRGRANTGKRWQQKHAAGWRSTGCGTSPSQLRWRWESERCFCPSGSGEGRFEAWGSYKFAALIEFGSVMLGRLDPSNCLMPKSQLLRTDLSAHRAMRMDAIFSGLLDDRQPENLSEPLRKSGFYEQVTGVKCFLSFPS